MWYVGVGSKTCEPAYRHRCNSYVNAVLVSCRDCLFGFWTRARAHVAVCVCVFIGRLHHLIFAPPTAAKFHSRDSTFLSHEGGAMKQHPVSAHNTNGSSAFVCINFIDKRSASLGGAASIFIFHTIHRTKKLNFENRNHLYNFYTLKSVRTSEPIRSI